MFIVLVFQVIFQMLKLTNLHFSLMFSVYEFNFQQEIFHRFTQIFYKRPKHDNDYMYIMSLENSD
jgi:hypothetical protein